MDQYDEEIEAMETKLDRLSSLAVVLPDGSPERADVQEQGLLLYRELEDAKESLGRRRQRDAASQAQEERVRRHRAVMLRRCDGWVRGACWTMAPGVLIVLASLPTESWQLRLIGFALVIVGVLCLLRMAALQRQASDSRPQADADLRRQYDRLGS